MRACVLLCDAPKTPLFSCGSAPLRADIVICQPHVDSSCATYTLHDLTQITAHPAVSMTLVAVYCDLPTALAPHMGLGSARLAAALLLDVTAPTHDRSTMLVTVPVVNPAGMPVGTFVELSGGGVVLGGFAGSASAPDVNGTLTVAAVLEGAAAAVLVYQLAPFGNWQYTTTLGACGGTVKTAAHTAMSQVPTATVVAVGVAISSSQQPSITTVCSNSSDGTVTLVTQIPPTPQFGECVGGALTTGRADG